MTVGGDARHLPKEAGKEVRVSASALRDLLEPFRVTTDARYNDVAEI